jgi:hypothetical protein
MLLDMLETGNMATYEESRSHFGACPHEFCPCPHEGGLYTARAQVFCFFLPGGLLHKQGPRRARLRAAPLPHSHNTLVVTSSFLQEGQVGNLKNLRTLGCAAN